MILALVVLAAAAPVAAADGTSSDAAGPQMSYSDSWGPASGSVLPKLDANDHTGTPVALKDLVGSRGLLLVLIRSADW